MHLTHIEHSFPIAKLTRTCVGVRVCHIATASTNLRKTDLSEVGVVTTTEPIVRAAIRREYMFSCTGVKRSNLRHKKSGSQNIEQYRDGGKGARLVGVEVWCCFVRVVPECVHRLCDNVEEARSQHTTRELQQRRRAHLTDVR